MKGYMNDERYSEFQNIVDQEGVKLNMEQIRCDTNGLFIDFINWMSLNYDARVICQVVENPHAFKEELKDFLIWREEL